MLIELKYIEVCVQHTSIYFNSIMHIFIAAFKFLEIKASD